jgi:hypothetical protein
MTALLYLQYVRFMDEKTENFQRFVPVEDRSFNDVGVDGKYEIGEGEIKKVYDSLFNSFDTPNYKTANNAPQKKLGTLMEDIVFKTDTSNSLERTEYLPLPVHIFNSHNQDLSLPNLMEYGKIDCDFPLVIGIDWNNVKHPDAEAIWNTWVNLSMKLHNYPENIIPVHEKIKKLPVKKIRFYINKNVKGYFNGCKLISKSSMTKYAIYVNSVEFIQGKFFDDLD